MHRKLLKNGIEIICFQTGTVAVHPPHREYQGIPALRIPSIMLSSSWTIDLPITVWLIKSPEGIFLVDTGENVNFFDEDYFGTDKPTAFINRRILKIKLTEAEQINSQLSHLDLSEADVDAIVLTHLHIDHTDGLRFFPNSEVLVSETVWKRPFGAATTTFPQNFAPKQIEYAPSDSPFRAAYQLTKNITIVPTPGHTFGHQSIIVHDDEIDYMLAGDTSFSDVQLLQGKRAGIIIDWGAAKNSYEKIKTYAAEKPLVYLPSHDLNTTQRLMASELLIAKPEHDDESN
ncbi:MAG: N-acyl homoserine lactonase family protein [Chloroflexota bacterium]